jgi:hypothetical protein
LHISKISQKKLKNDYRQWLAEEVGDTGGEGEEERRRQQPKS